MVGPLGVVVSPFRPTSQIEGRGPYHHDEAARDLGAWPDCWVSVEFLHDPIRRKGSGSTTTITLGHKLLYFLISVSNFLTNKIMFETRILIASLLKFVVFRIEMVPVYHSKTEASR